MAINPLVQIFRPISPLAWIPIAILWFGVGDLSAIFLIFLASLLPLMLTAINAVNSIPAVHLNAGRNFGLSPARLVATVLYSRRRAATARRTAHHAGRGLAGRRRGGDDRGQLRARAS